jgi:hypothetical protein
MQYMSVFEEFLYTRELSFREYMLMTPPQSSPKKTIDS